MISGFVAIRQFGMTGICFRFLDCLKVTAGSLLKRLFVRSDVVSILKLFLNIIFFGRQRGGNQGG